MQMKTDIKNLKPYTLCILMQDIPGVLSQVARLFSRKGYNIESIVSGATDRPGITRISIEIIADELKNPSVKLVALSGPTHAEEVALDMPTTIVSASASTEAAEQVQELFQHTCIRAYTNTDVLGVELSGAMKNIIALASGIATGLGCGDNTKAAIITRGIAEIARLGVAMGCSEQTFGGLAGIGDLIVTATSVHSRNNRCGMLLGQGVPADEAIRQVGMVVEGINALPAAMQLMARYQVEMPIVAAVNAIVNEGAAPAGAVHKLMNRDTKAEIPADHRFRSH